MKTLMTIKTFIKNMIDIKDDNKDNSAFFMGDAVTV